MSSLVNHAERELTPTMPNPSKCGSQYSVMITEKREFTAPSDDTIALVNRQKMDVCLERITALEKQVKILMDKHNRDEAKRKRRNQVYRRVEK